jgi:hypothetical protein
MMVDAPDAPDLPQGSTQLYIYSADDIEGRLGDAFVDIRELPGMDDETAAEALDLVHQHLFESYHTR